MGCPLLIGAVRHGVEANNKQGWAFKAQLVSSWDCLCRLVTCSHALGHRLVHVGAEELLSCKWRHGSMHRRNHGCVEASWEKAMQMGL